jgi:hypothetical protein
VIEIQAERKNVIGNIGTMECPLNRDHFNFVTLVTFLTFNHDNHCH